MTKAKSKTQHTSATIAQNKKARHDYFVEQQFEAGMVLMGWEVKSLRAGKGNLTEAYVIFKDGEAWLFGAHISPLSTASTHVDTDPVRTRKLLLHQKELSEIFGAVQKKGYTCVPLSLFWKKGLAKCNIALVKGKHLYDKRATEKERDWTREKSRVLKRNNK